MRLPGNVSSLKPHEMRPQNETMERHAGKGPRDEALGWNPKTKCPKVFKTGLECGIFFRTSAAKPASPSLQLNITPGRFLKEIHTLSSPPKEQIQEPARKTPQRKKARVARCAAQQWLE